MMFNSNSLPADPMNLQVAPIQFTMDNPPYAPQRVNCPNELVPYVPGICALLANELQEKATGQGSNPLRVFAYNLCAPNRFATEAFDNLVHSTLDLIVYMLSPPASINNPTIENAIQAAVPEMVYMMCAVNCRQYPALGQMIQQGAANMVGTINGLISQFDFLCNDIQSMKQGNPKSANTSMGNRSAFGGGSFGRANNNNRGSFGANQASTSSRGFGGGFGQQPAQQSTQGSTGLFNNRGNTTTGGSFGNKGSFGLAVSNQSNETAKTGNYPSQPFSKGNNMSQSDTKFAEELSFEQKPTRVDYKDTDFVPSLKYPYFPAFNPVRFEMQYEIQGDDSTQPIAIKRNPDMDYDRHAMPSIFGSVPDSYDLSATAKNLARIQKGILAINAEATEAAAHEKAHPDAEEKFKTTLHAPMWFVETSLNAAWLELQLQRLGLDIAPEVYRANATVATPIIVAPNEADVVKSLSKCMTYVGIRAQLDEAFDKMSPELYQAINGRLTQNVNRSIRLEMGIPKLSMTDFRADIEEVIEYIGDRFGKEAQRAFLSRQESHIRQATSLVGENNTAEIVESMLEGKEFPENEKPTMLCLCSDYSLTLVNCTSHDLELELGNNGLGSAVTAELVPEVYKLVEGLFSAPHADIVHRFLIRTNDGRILEAAKGALGEDYYTLSLVS